MQNYRFFLIQIIHETAEIKCFPYSVDHSGGATEITLEDSFRIYSRNPQKFFARNARKGSV